MCTWRSLSRCAPGATPFDPLRLCRELVCCQIAGRPVPAARSALCGSGLWESGPQPSQQGPWSARAPATQRTGAEQRRRVHLRGWRRGLPLGVALVAAAAGVPAAPALCARERVAQRSLPQLASAAAAGAPAAPAACGSAPLDTGGAPASTAARSTGQRIAQHGLPQLTRAARGRTSGHPPDLRRAPAALPLPRAPHRRHLQQGRAEAPLHVQDQPPAAVALAPGGVHEGQGAPPRPLSPLSPPLVSMTTLLMRRAVARAIRTDSSRHLSAARGVCCAGMPGASRVMPSHTMSKPLPRGFLPRALWPHCQGGAHACVTPPS